MVVKVSNVLLLNSHPIGLDEITQDVYSLVFSSFPARSLGNPGQLETLVNRPDYRFTH